MSRVPQGIFEIMTLFITCDLMNFPLRILTGVKSNFYLQHGGVGGITKKNIKPTNISQFVKVYLSTPNITNNPSGQNIEFTLG